MNGSERNEVGNKVAVANQVKTQRKVDVALELDKLSTNWLAEFDPEEAVEFVKRAEYYNNFTNEDLVNLIESINKIIPRFWNGEDNPNNGSYIHTFYIGNEDTRVIYLSLFKDWDVLKNFDFNEIEKKLEELGRKAKADEYEAVVNSKYYFKYRFWWD
jgi:hypothetical protein